MRTTPEPLCPNCGSKGRKIHGDLRDRLFGAPGTWQMERCENATCDTCWLNPAPSPEDLSIAYRNYYTHRYDPVHEGFGARLRARLQKAYVERRLGYPQREGLAMRLLSGAGALTERSEGWLYEYFYLPWIPGGRLLEVGCGSGRQLAALREAGWAVSGVDFDPVAVAAARERGLDVVTGDIRDLKFAAGQFDAVVMAHVLEHVRHPTGLLAECARLLKPGGRLVSITPNGRSLGHRIYGSAWRGLEPPRHLAVFSPQSLRLVADNAGLEVDRVRVTARDAANLLLASRRLRDAVDDQPIEQPSIAKPPPIDLRLLAFVERIANGLGLQWGEELVLVARRSARA